MSVQDSQVISSNSLSIVAIWQEAWHLVHGFKWPLFKLYVIYPIVFHVLLLVLSWIGGNFLHAVLPVATPYLKTVFPAAIVIVELLFFWSIVVCDTMLGVRRALGLTATIGAVYGECRPVLKQCLFLSLGGLLVFFAVSYQGAYQPTAHPDTVSLSIHTITLLFLLYVTLPFMLFTIPLVIVKRMGIWLAIKLSYRAMWQHGFKVIVLYVMMMIICFISSIPFGLGLIWTKPMFSAMTGILFRDIFKGADTVR